MKDQILSLQRHCESEIIVCDDYLKDLPTDINSIEELEDIMGNNKDLSRAYDLGRKEALQEIKKLLKK
jgi:hypothetical protein